MRPSRLAALKSWLPPVAGRLYWRLFPRFRYLSEREAAAGLPASSGGWNAGQVVAAERAKWDAYRALVQSAAPLGFSHEQPVLDDVRNLYHHNVHLGFAYALARATRMRTRASVLDWGGGLGHYYLLARALYPDLALDYVVKEMPSIAAAGRVLLPDVRWRDDDDVLEGQYDLVMVNGSLQYMTDWRGFLTRAARAARGYFLLTRVPVVQRAPRYAARQSEYGTEMIHWQFNQGELLAHMASTGLRLERELVVGGVPYVRGAPEQAEMRGWLFAREEPPEGLHPVRDPVLY